MTLTVLSQEVDKNIFKAEYILFTNVFLVISFGSKTVNQPHEILSPLKVIANMLKYHLTLQAYQKSQISIQGWSP